MDLVEVPCVLVLNSSPLLAHLEGNHRPEFCVFQCRECLMLLLAHSGCYNKIPQTG